MYVHTYVYRIIFCWIHFFIYLQTQRSKSSENYALIHTCIYGYKENTKYAFVCKVTFSLCNNYSELLPIYSFSRTPNHTLFFWILLVLIIIWQTNKQRESCIVRVPLQMIFSFVLATDLTCVTNRNNNDNKMHLFYFNHFTHKLFYFYDYTWRPHSHSHTYEQFSILTTFKIIFLIKLFNIITILLFKFRKWWNE